MKIKHYRNLWSSYNYYVMHAGLSTLGRGDDTWRYNAQYIWRHLCKKYSSTPDTKCAKKDVVSILTFDLTRLLNSHQSNIIILQLHTTVYEEMFNVNSKVTQTMQHEILLSVSWIYEKWQTSVITRRFQTLIWKPRDMVQNLEWVDSTVHDWCNCNMNQKEFLLDWLSIFRPQGYLALVWMHQLTFSSAESSSLKQLDSLKIDMWMNQFLAIL